MTQVIEVVAPRSNPDDVALVIEGVEFGGWTDVRVTRGIERMPSDFVVSLTENYPNASHYLQIKPGQPVELYIGKDRVITGYIDRVAPSIDARSHTVAVSGRGMCADLVDCAAEWPGGQVVESSVLEVARKLAAPFGISVNGEAGPPVGGGAKGGAPVLIPQFVLMLGEKPWEVIERLCRIAALLAYDQPNGSLRLAANPATIKAGLVSTQGGFTVAASGFAEGVNVKSASGVFGMDQRYSHYRAYRYSFDSFRDMGSGEAANLLGEFKEEGVTRYRPHVILMELGKSMAEANAKKRAQWEAKRRWGRSYQVNVVTDSWRDSAGALYAPNTLAGLDIPSVKVEGVDWLIAEVTYRLSEAGTECDVLLMPTDAFDVQPTLPAYAIPFDVAQNSAGLGGRP